ncbi:MAG: formate dehydrogenase subunit alpha [Armatimonadetes bacterium]|nr:formate dehydrogenase subunit alpha [Armatimonadota bacterium]
MNNDQITLTIDGVAATVHKGATIFQAARSVGIDIPHLCYDPELDLLPSSSCRLCVVEVEGARGPVASCSHPAAQGMAVRTQSESLQEMRRMVIELLLSDHPHECYTCGHSGLCVLETYAYDMGLRERRMAVTTTVVEPDRDTSALVHDESKCILCGRCVAVCHGVQAAGAIDFFGRGFDTEISLPPGVSREDSECEWCGNCAEVCPTGAISAGRMSFLPGTQKVRTTCTYCGVGCQFDLNVWNGRVVGVTTKNDNPVNGPWLCVKGRFGYEFIHNADRLTKPLVRRDGELVEASWDEALDYVAKRLTQIKAESGPDSIALMSSSRCTNEENFLMQKLARAVIGTNNVDQCARTCHAPTVAGLAEAFGSGAMTNSIGEIPHATVIFMIGANPTEAHPIIGLKIKEAVANGANLIVVDPREIWLTSLASLHIPIKPGTDLALINAMAYTIIHEGLADEEFIKSRTEGYEEFRKVAEEWPPERAAEVCEVSAEDIRTAARAYATAERGAIIYTLGITEHTCGTRNVLGLADLAMLTGQIGRESTGVNPLRGQNNVQGSCDMGALPDTYPGYQKVAVEANRLKFEEAWGVKLPQSKGMMIPDMLEGAFEGHLKALYILGEDPMMSEPHTHHVRQCLENLDFLVVQEIFLSDTAKMADVVLPASCFAEKDGTFTNTERRVQRVRKAVDAPGEAREDWRIITEISKRLGYPMEYASPKEIWDEIARLSPPFAGINYERIDKVGLQFPCPTPDHPGTKFLHNGRFTRGLGKFTPVPHTPPAEVTDAEYPLILTTGRTLYHYNVGTMTRRSAASARKSPDNFVEIHPADLEKLGGTDGQMLRVNTRRGTIVARAIATKKVKRGRIWMPFHFSESSANVLTIDALDEITKTPEYKVAAARVEVAVD